ncbi:MAG: hypothetical protein ACTTJ6_00900 [Treponema sp.]
MPLPYVSENILAVGYNCFVRIGNSANDAKNVAFVESYSITQDYQVQEARVLGQLMPISIDAQGYSCNINLSGFTPSPEIYEKIRGGTAQMGYNLEKCLSSIVPNAREFMDSGVITKIPYIDFVTDIKNPSVLVHAEGVLIANTTLTAQGTGYLKYSVSLRALVGENGYK